MPTYVRAEGIGATASSSHSFVDGSYRSRELTNSPPLLWPPLT
eukprot:CAMPEP_0202746300 /NCGR_PEP_ID=MMETSP1388-20130828/8040_1 /ASSEMBLY_ACC=CAM_ASM_000864 /TAXON_ID=37098 /ORGANISM="Isochrysis sp, Strain CCMP1244" /LENGTH=42 /DNA_ID= /DNA_START= /DNA_END= /DNA_ORIENTATION=